MTKKKTSDARGDSAADNQPSPASPELASLIRDYLATDQPRDCKKASKEKLVAAMGEAPGPVTYANKIVSLDGEDVVVEDVPAEEANEADSPPAGGSPPDASPPPAA
jgi:hypothetical protein